MTRDWPLLLVAAVLFVGAAGRYMAGGGSDTLVSILSCMGSAAFGAWLYSIGVDKERDRNG